MEPGVLDVYTGVGWAGRDKQTVIALQEGVES